MSSRPLEHIPLDKLLHIMFSVRCEIGARCHDTVASDVLADIHSLLAVRDNEATGRTVVSPGDLHTMLRMLADLTCDPETSFSVNHNSCAWGDIILPALARQAVMLVAMTKDTNPKLSAVVLLQLQLVVIRWCSACPDDHDMTDTWLYTDLYFLEPDVRESIAHGDVRALISPSRSASMESMSDDEYSRILRVITVVNGRDGGDHNAVRTMGPEAIGNLVWLVNDICDGALREWDKLVSATATDIRCVCMAQRMFDGDTLPRLTVSVVHNDDHTGVIDATQVIRVCVGHSELVVGRRSPEYMEYMRCLLGVPDALATNGTSTDDNNGQPIIESMDGSVMHTSCGKKRIHWDSLYDTDSDRTTC